MSRVVLVSDGVANVGDTGPGGILERISTQARAGTSLISVGVGIANYNDHLLEQLADRGDGWHVYVDTAAGGRAGLRARPHGLARGRRQGRQGAGRVRPGPGRGYRLLGYENRDVADQDFRNDAVDGGEVFAGHATTALYDVELREGARRRDAFVTATVRYLDAGGRAGRAAPAARATPSAPRPRRGLARGCARTWSSRC